MLKNVAGQKVGAQLTTAADGTPFTGSVTVAVTVDAGTQATGSVGSGACTHEGGGYHTYAPAQAETNGDLLAFTFSGTGAISVTVQVYPLPTTGVLAPTTAGRTLTVEADGMAHADLKEIGGDAQSMTDLKDFADAGYDPSTNKVQGVVLVDTLTTLTGHTPQTADHTAAIAALPLLAQILAAFGAVTGAVEDEAGNSSTVFQTNLAESTNDHYNGGTCVFTSGTNAGQVRRITDYVGATGTITVDPAFDAEPTAADAFLIIGRIQ